MPESRKRNTNNMRNVRNTKGTKSINGNKQQEKNNLYKTKRKKTKSNTKTKKIVIRVLIGLAILFLVIAGIGAGILFGMFQKYTIPMDMLRISTENTVILDTDGNVIATLNASEKRESITLEEMGKYIPAAFIAIEDERFYDHQGVDIKRTAAATIKYIFKGSSSFGGSTITQQLVKNITKEDERDATRKIKEMARAYNLEKTLTKDKILELYLNMIFMGEDVFGVQMGAKLYFNKNASELDLAEAAFLAGINNSPNMYKPFEDNEEMKEKIKSRTLTVIEKMYDLGKIETEEYNQAVEKVKNGLTFTKGSISANNYSYHVDAVIEQAITQIQKKNPEMNREAAEYYLYNGGLTIYSTQVTSIQSAMEEEYKNTKFMIPRTVNVKDENGNIVKDENGKNVQKTITTQSAMVIIDHKTGQVVGCVGGFGEKAPRGLNRATQTPKQPGSSIKPLAVIAPSLEAGLITAGTVIDDTPVSYPNWTPNNDDFTFRGLTNVRTIIKYSRNIPEIKMINTLGPENSVKYLRKLGLKSVVDEDANPATALGGLTKGATTLEMAAAYASIANDGVYIEPTFFTKIEDPDGNVVLEVEQEKRTVMSQDNACILRSILRGPLESGGTAASSGVKVANMDTCGKTGTADNWNRWFCGFTPYYAAATWFGFDDQSLQLSHEAYNRAAITWGNVMRKIHADLQLEAKNFSETGNIVSVPICTKSGLLPTELCKNAGCVYTEKFVKGTAPTKSCETHVQVKVCVGEDGKVRLATEFCPDAEERIFITRPNSNKDRSWEKAADAKDMLPEETCEEHTKIEEPEVEPSPSPTPTTPATSTPTTPPTPTTPTTQTSTPTTPATPTTSTPQTPASTTPASQPPESTAPASTPPETGTN